MTGGGSSSRRRMWYGWGRANTGSRGRRSIVIDNIATIDCGGTLLVVLLLLMMRFGVVNTNGHSIGGQEMGEGTVCIEVVLVKYLLGQ